MARNLGGSVGLALLGTFIDRRNTFHDDMIRESVTANSLIGQEHVAQSAAGFFAQHGDMAYAKMQALGQLAAQMQLQASVITFSETFYVLAVALLLCIPLAFLLKKPAPGTPSAGH
jgi:DHA2 family multidrug resistance protein